MRSELTGTVYAVTKWRDIDADKGTFEAITKHDVTDQFNALVRLLDNELPRCEKCGVNMQYHESVDVAGHVFHPEER